jgi:hypothetical protein
LFCSFLFRKRRRKTSRGESQKQGCREIPFREERPKEEGLPQLQTRSRRQCFSGAAFGKAGLKCFFETTRVGIALLGDGSILRPNADQSRGFSRFDLFRSIDTIAKM